MSLTNGSHELRKATTLGAGFAAVAVSIPLALNASLLYAVPAFIGLSSIGLVIAILRYKEPSFTFATAFKRYVLTKVLYFLGIFYEWQQRVDSHHVRKIQEKVLFQFFRLNKDTEYFATHKLGDVKCREDFVRIHPLTKYEHYRSYVERMMDGEQNVFSGDKLMYFGATSGTTGKPSIVPFVKAQVTGMYSYFAMLTKNITDLVHQERRHKRTQPNTGEDASGRRGYMFSANQTVAESVRGMRLFYNPQRLLTKTPSGVLMGPISAAPIPGFSKKDIYTTPPEGFEIPNDTAAHYVHLLFGLRQKELMTIDGIFTSLVYFAFQFMEMNWRELVRDIRNGTLSQEMIIPDDIRQALVKRLFPMEDRANELEAEFQKGFDNIALRIWPKLCLIIAIGSGSFAQYSTILKEKYTKDIVIYTPYYAATEGFMAMNFWPERPLSEAHFMLAIRAMFFEFLPIENSHEDQPKTYFAEEVEIGKEYEVVLTNACGLCRYRIGDVVKIADFYNQTPILQFMNRASQHLNIRGEKITENVLHDAVNELSKEFSVKHNFTRILDFTSCESINLSHFDVKSDTGAPFNSLFIELQGVIEVDKAAIEKEMSEAVDQYLIAAQSKNNMGTVNIGYKNQRQKGGLAQAKVFLVNQGTFQSMREFMLTTTSTSPSQLKIPRVLRKQQLVDFIWRNRMK